jgi:hypothetical protein
MFYVTKDNVDGSKELVETIKVSREEAYEVYLKVINEQCYEYHKTKTLQEWRVIRLFDENGVQIAQEN